jgi:hypothetical protein
LPFDGHVLGRLGALLPESFEDELYLSDDEPAAHPDGQRYLEERRYQACLLRDIFGNPFRPVEFSPDRRTDTALSLARQMYDGREFSAMPILADALSDAGCGDDDILGHCRGPERGYSSATGGSSTRTVRASASTSTRPPCGRVALNAVCPTG